MTYTTTMELPVIGLWIGLNLFAAYLTYRTIKLINDPRGQSTGDVNDAAGVDSAGDSSPHRSDSAVGSVDADVEGVRCSNCGRVQEAGFTFCENCIETLL